MNQSNDCDIARYAATVEAYPTLSRQEEVALFRRWRDQTDERARDTLVRAALRHVVSIARKHRRYGVSLGELIAEGNFRVERALQKFDTERGTLFVTYARYWIRASILHCVLRAWSIVGSGMPRSKLFFKLRRERAKLTNLVGEGDQADALLAERLGISNARLQGLLRRVDQRDFSLDAEVFADTGTSLIHTLAAAELDQEQLSLAREFGSEAQEAVRDALAILDERERYIVDHRLLADPEAELSLADIGRQLGVSRERVRQLEMRAKCKLRAYISARPNARDWLDVPWFVPNGGPSVGLRRNVTSMKQPPNEWRAHFARGPRELLGRKRPAALRVARPCKSGADLL
jgi:RNA polymerase sigma-32 factor